MANMKKTKCMAIKPKCDKGLYVQTFILKDRQLKQRVTGTTRSGYITDDLKDDSTIEK